MTIFVRQVFGLYYWNKPDAAKADKAEIENNVEQILDAKRENPQADTSKLECEIDCLVYKLYDLSEDEIRIVKGEA